MEIVGVTLAIPPLLLECTKVAKLCHDMQTKFQNAPNSLAHIITECNSVTHNLSEAQDLDAEQLAYLPDDRRDPFRQQINRLTLGCINILSKIERDLEAFKEFGDDGVIVGPLRRFGRKDRMRFVWNEDEITELLERLRGYETSLTLSLSLLKVRSDNDIRQLVQTQGAILTSFLQRHHSSRQRDRKQSHRFSQDSIQSNQSSLLSDTAFDFDNEAINSRAYRQALSRRRIKKLVSAPLQQQQSIDDAFSMEAVLSLNVVPSVRRSVMEEFEELVSEVESVLSDSLSTFSSMLDLYMGTDDDHSIIGDVDQVEEEDRSSTPTQSGVDNRAIRFEGLITDINTDDGQGANLTPTENQEDAVLLGNAQLKRANARIRRSHRSTMVAADAAIPVRSGTPTQRDYLADVDGLDEVQSKILPEDDDTLYRLSLGGRVQGMRVGRGLEDMPTAELSSEENNDHIGINNYLAQTEQIQLSMVTYRNTSSRFSIISTVESVPEELPSPTNMDRLQTERLMALEALSANSSISSSTAIGSASSLLFQHRRAFSDLSGSTAINTIQPNLHLFDSADSVDGPRNDDPRDNTSRFSTSSETDWTTLQRRISAPLPGNDFRMSCDLVQEPLFSTKYKTARPLSLNSLPTTPKTRAGSIKCVLVGDAGDLKTKMLWQYVDGELSDVYIRRIFPNYAVTVMVGGDAYTLGLFDTTGMEEYDRLRAHMYALADVVLICLDLKQPSQFASAETKWIPDIREHCPRALSILVGATDSEDSSDGDSGVIDGPTETAKRRRVALENGALTYLECDVRAGDTILNVFNEAIAAVIEQRLRLKKPRGTRKWLRELLRPISEQGGE